MKRKSMISTLPILFLAFSMLIPSAFTKRPGVDPEPGKFTVEIFGENINGTIKAVGWIYQWSVHFRANYDPNDPDPLPEPPKLNCLPYVGEDQPGNDFELEVNKKSGKALLFFAWSVPDPDNPKILIRYRLLVSAKYDKDSEECNGDAEIYKMGRGKGQHIGTIEDVSFTFSYSPGWG